MESSEQEHTFILKTPRTRIFGHRAHEVQKWRVEVTLKERGGVHYLLREVADTHLSFPWLQAEAYRSGIFSPRPYVLGMPTNQSMARCVLALTQVLCAKRGADPYALWYKAHPRLGISRGDLIFIAQQAQWEGFVYPKVWDTKAVTLLIDALRTSGSPALADVVQSYFGESQN